MQNEKRPLELPPTPAPAPNSSGRKQPEKPHRCKHRVPFMEMKGWLAEQNEESKGGTKSTRAHFQARTRPSPNEGAASICPGDFRTVRLSDTCAPPGPVPFECLWWSRCACPTAVCWVWAGVGSADNWSLNSQVFGLRATVPQELPWGRYAPGASSTSEPGSDADSGL